MKNFKYLVKKLQWLINSLKTSKYYTQIQGQIVGVDYPIFLYTGPKDTILKECALIYNFGKEFSLI